MSGAANTSSPCLKIERDNLGFLQVDYKTSATSQTFDGHLSEKEYLVFITANNSQTPKRGYSESELIPLFNSNNIPSYFYKGSNINNELAVATNTNEYKIKRAITNYIQRVIEDQLYNEVYRKNQYRVWCIYIDETSGLIPNNDAIASCDDISYLHRLANGKGGWITDKRKCSPVGSLYLNSGYYYLVNNKTVLANGDNMYVSVNTKSSPLDYTGIQPGAYLQNGHDKVYKLTKKIDSNTDAPCYLVETKPVINYNPDTSQAPGSDLGPAISQEVEQNTPLTLDYTSSTINLTSNYISNFSNWKINYIPFSGMNERKESDSNNFILLTNTMGTKNEKVLIPFLKSNKIDIDIEEFCDILDKEIYNSKVFANENGYINNRLNLSIILEIVLKTNPANQITLKQYFCSDIDKASYNFIYKKWDNTAARYIEDSNISFSTFLEEANPILKNTNQVCFDTSLLLKQEKEVLNLYSLELFEAYTRGHDFIQEKYTTVRPQERNPEDSSETSRIMDYKDNYFTYKYSGRDIDIFNCNTNRTELINGWNKDKYNQPVYLGIAHECDVLLESDITLGDAYGEQEYFIEAIKAPIIENDRETGNYYYKDTFKVKDYLDVNNGGYDSTIYTEDDIEVITSKIDLNRCKYYNPKEATYENQWCDCSFNSNGGAAKEECIYQKLGYCPYRFSTEKHPRRIRTLQQQKSNRFNLIQELSKVFTVYPYFYIEHDDRGKILLDENGKMKKHVFYMTEKGNEQKLGFRYEKNLASISRTLDSSSITTKLYVENIDSSYSKTGLNSIQTATDNIGKTSYILDFSYYINNGSIDAEAAQRDVYGIDKNDLAFLPRIGAFNTTYDKYSNLIISLTGETMVELQAQNEVAIAGITTSLEERKKIGQTMYQFKATHLDTSNGTYYTTSDTYKNYIIKYREQTSILWGLVEDLFFSNDYFSMPIITLTEDNKEIYNFDIIKYGEEISSSSTYSSIYNKYKDKYCKGELFWRLVMEGFPDDSYIPPFNKWVEFKEKIVDTNLYEVNGNLGKYKSLSNEVKHQKTERAKILNKINDLSEQFYKKYEPYIKEGTFSDSNYLTDNEYYWGSVQVLRDSCKPKISYSFKVIDLSFIDEDYTYDLADSTFVEDIDFFGINPKTGLPNHQKVIINEIGEDLDKPEDTTINIVNYTTDFSDLFEAITATVQSLTFNENVYKRASNFTAKQYITTESLQDTLDIGDLTLMDTPKDNIIIDEEGTKGNDINNTASQYKITGQGVEFSTDGGETWDYGVGPKGINLDYARIGSLDTSKIQIIDGEYIYFLWDKDGINSYRNPATSTSGLVDFTRFNRYGLSLIENNNVRLRAGYEYKSNKEGYNQTGNYKEELPLTNQNIGFYLYNDKGQAIFKTETQSDYNDSNTDYSARLSLTGEMFVTNKILGAAAAIPEGENTQTVQRMSVQWYFENKTVFSPVDGRQIIMDSYQLKDMIENNYLTVLSDPERPDGDTISTEGGYQHTYSYQLDDLTGTGYFKISEEAQDNGHYIYNIPELYILEIYSLLDTTSTSPVEEITFKITHLNSAYFETTEQIILNSTNGGFSSDRVLSWIANEDFENNGLPDIIANYDSDKIAAQNAIYSYQIETYKCIVRAGTDEDDNTYTQDDIGKILVSTVEYSYIDRDESSVYKTVQNPFLRPLEYLDSNGNYNEANLYRITENGQETFWEVKEITDDIVISSDNGFTNSEVGIFINNKKALDFNDTDVDRTNNSDQTISKNATDEQNALAQEAILSGAERTFMISSLSNSKTDIKYNNILSVLKNGSLYLGGTITDYYGKNLNIGSLSYMPDEVRISNPSIVMSRNGQIWCDWSSFYLAYKENGVYKYTTFSLMDFVNAIQNWTGTITSSTIDETSADYAEVAGYYFDDNNAGGTNI